MDSQKNNIVTNIISPFQRFFEIEASGGIVLLFFTLVAILWANSAWGDIYNRLWEYELSIGIGKYTISNTILHWINDGLMAIFFFVVGLEIKREILVGELSSPRKAALPIFAAIGGMLLPALIYSVMNKNAETASGWGIPMATDIAFSLAVLSLLGKRVPLSLKVFLVAFAIVDDLGAVAIIALFYTPEVQIKYLLIGLGLYLYLLLFNYFKLRIIHLYMILGWIIWFMFLKSGIHPTIAGVLIAFTIPIGRKTRVGTFRRRINSNLSHFCDDDCNDKVTLTDDQISSIDNMESELKKVQSPLQSLEHRLHGFVTYIVIPAFALTNAGVVFGRGAFEELLNPLSITIESSLVAGKVFGIFIFTWLAVKLGFAELPVQTKWIHILGIGFIGGIGFTMSLFITNLAFDQQQFINPAKIGIFVGSLVAGILGFFMLRIFLRKNDAMQ